LTGLKKNTDSLNLRVLFGHLKDLYYKELLHENAVLTRSQQVIFGPSLRVADPKRIRTIVMGEWIKKNRFCSRDSSDVTVRKELYSDVRVSKTTNCSTSSLIAKRYLGGPLTNFLMTITVSGRWAVCRSFSGQSCL